MTLAYWCVLIAALLPFPYTLIAKWSKRFDNRKPREYLEATQGWRRRAHSTQINSFEAFPAFAAGVIIAHLAQAPQNRIELFAAAFIVLRVLYGLCYLADRATLRSIMWFGAMTCTVGLFVIAT